jgi:folylpolyglutamate synthase/dihydrofolate synthase
VSEREFLKVEDHYKRLNERNQINASEFELLTATAFTLFNENKVDVGIIEVGMGGKLDATNILNNQVVSVISKVARDHENFLGNTLEEIASHKAGILRPNVPFIVNPSNEFNVHEVIENYAQEIGAGPRILVDTADLRSLVFGTKTWRKFSEGLLPFQRDNAVLGMLAYIEVLKSLGLNTDLRKVVVMLDKMRNKQTLPGRQQTLFVRVVFGAIGKRREILVDGAHNPDAAESLDAYVSQKLRRQARDPVTWVLAMTEGKDPRRVLQTLLRPGDNVVTTAFGPVDGMPWVKSMDPESLLNIALEVCPGITALAVPKRGAYRALCTAKYISKHAHIVLTGSLYLVGDFFREHEVGKECMKNGEDFPSIREIDQDERARVDEFFDEVSRRAFKEDVQPDEIHSSSATPETGGGDLRADDGPSSPATAIPSPPVPGQSENLRKLQAEMAQLESEMQSFQRGTSGRAHRTPPAKQKFFENFEDFRTLVEPSSGSSPAKKSEDGTQKSFSFSSETRARPAGDLPVRRTASLKIRLQGSPRNDPDSEYIWKDMTKEAELRADKIRGSSRSGRGRASSF